jgi:hypothetical protein
MIGWDCSDAGNGGPSLRLGNGGRKPAATSVDAASFISAFSG